MTTLHPMRFELHLNAAALCYIGDLAATLDTDLETAASVLLCMAGEEFVMEQQAEQRTVRRTAPPALRVLPPDRSPSA